MSHGRALNDSKNAAQYVMPMTIGFVHLEALTQQQSSLINQPPS
jgi:hypothetical protein